MMLRQYFSRLYVYYMHLYNSEEIQHRVSGLRFIFVRRVVLCIPKTFWNTKFLLTFLKSQHANNAQCQHIVSQLCSIVGRRDRIWIHGLFLK